jgi:hypothetical protein
MTDVAHPRHASRNHCQLLHSLFQRQVGFHVLISSHDRQRLTRRLLNGLLVAVRAHGVDKGGGIALRLEGVEPRDSGTCLGSRL